MTKIIRLVPLHFFCVFQVNYSSNMDFMAKNPENAQNRPYLSLLLLLFHPIAITKKFHSLHFSIFSLELLNIASQLNLAANYWVRFFNLDFGAILAQFSGKLRRLFIYKLVMKNHGFWRYLPFSIFRACWGLKKGVVHRHQYKPGTSKLNQKVDLLGAYYCKKIDQSAIL